jgi:hypothetical protein
VQRRRISSLYLGLGALLTAVGVTVATTRPLDNDEGVYAYASKLVGHGRLPYADFTYPQTPLLPFAYGPWLRAFGESWVGLRMLSVVFTVALGLLVYRHCSCRFGARFGLLAFALFASSGAVIGWLPIIKTYALSTLLLFGAYTMVDRRAPTSKAWILGGSLFGLAIGVRALFAAAAPALAVTAGRRARPLGLLVVGTTIGLLPSLMLFAIAPSASIHDSATLQANRTPSGLIGDFRQKGHIFLSLFGLRTPDGASGVQFLLLVLAAAAAASAALALGRRLSAALPIAICLGLASLLPTPTFVQYFCTTYPFLIVCVIEGLALVGGLFRQDPRARRALQALAAAPLAFYLAGGLLDLHRYGLFARGGRDDSISLAEQVTSALDARSRPGEDVVSWWPGYFLGSHATSAAGSLPVSNTGSRVELLLRTRRVHLIVYKQWLDTTSTRPWESEFVRDGYRLVTTVGTAKIYALRRRGWRAGRSLRFERARL